MCPFPLFQTCDPNVQRNPSTVALTQFETQVNVLRQDYVTAISDLVANGTDGAIECVQAVSDAEAKLAGTRMLRVATRLVSCRTLNRVYAKGAHDEYCGEVPVDLYSLCLCLFLPVVFIFLANLLVDIFLLDEPTVEPFDDDEKMAVHLGKFTADEVEGEPAEVLRVAVAHDVAVAEDTASERSHSPKGSQSSRSDRRSPAASVTAGDDFAPQDIETPTGAAAANFAEAPEVSAFVSDEEAGDEGVVDVVDVNIEDQGARDTASSSVETIMPLDEDDDGGVNEEGSPTPGTSTQVDRV
jgi:hypothetical protein